LLNKVDEITKLIDVKNVELKQKQEELAKTQK